MMTQERDAHTAQLFAVGEKRRGAYRKHLLLWTASRRSARGLFVAWRRGETLYPTSPPKAIKQSGLHLSLTFGNSQQSRIHHELEKVTTLAGSEANITVVLCLVSIHPHLSLVSATDAARRLK
mmetsp:Transcript_26192/g.78906  ORF Transcript_26192/g.78906 Transcript_26192/m.78906 type:complete len:123 (+) Transcript_26192:904-1272(+)